MIYPANFEAKTGFDKVRQLVSAHCLSPLGRERVADLSFSTDLNYLTTELHRTDEFVHILQEEDNFPTDYFLDVREALKKVRVEGTYLLERELFDLRRSLETINAIVRFFATASSEGKAAAPYPCLAALAAEVTSFTPLTHDIDRLLDKFGSMKDTASPELGRIRQQLAQTVNGISKTLNSILRSAQAEGLVEKDVAPTMRDGRLVIPISPAFKRKLKGIVHDESATGKTVFIEPAAVVEANNQIRELESLEKREVIRLLIAFTDRMRPLVPDVARSYRFLAEIDFIRAKAAFALDIQAVLPALEEQPHIDWHTARHPLLLLTHRTVVPLDIQLGGEATDAQRILIVSGPNAGGKSVLLKTVGLLQYMLQTGLLVPLDERSKMGLFDDLLLDIAIASPAICALRLFKDKDLAEQLAKEIAAMFNSPEAIAVVKLAYGKSDNAYYKNVLKYCVDGNFAAMLDEYAHILGDGNSESLCAQMCDALEAKTANYPIDTFFGGASRTPHTTQFGRSFRISGMLLYKCGIIISLLKIISRPIFMAGRLCNDCTTFS
jgi:DNA mismatch repair protein MutS2